LTKNNKKKIERTMAPSLSGLSNNLMLTKLKKNQNKKKIRTKRVNLKKKKTSTLRKMRKNKAISRQTL
jgi:hypothetical protein